MKRRGEQAWVSQRRAAVRAQAATGSAKGHLSVDSGQRRPGFKFNKANIREAKFQKAKRLRHKLQAILDGSIDPNSVSTAELRDVIEYKQRLEKNKKTLATEHRRQQGILKPVSAHMEVKGKHVFYDAGVMDPDRRAEHARRYHVRVVDDVCSADLIVVRGFDATSCAARWSARLVGQMLVCLDFFDKPENAACVMYKRGIFTKRQVYFTHQCVELHPSVHQMVHRASSLPGSKWTLLDTREALQQAWQKACARDKKAEVWVVKAMAESRAEFPDGIKYIMSTQEMCTLLEVLDRAKCRLGVCST